MGTGSSAQGHPEYGFLTPTGKQTMKFDAEQRRQSSLEESKEYKEGYKEQMHVKEQLLKSQKKHRDTIRKDDRNKPRKDQHLHRKLSKLHTNHEIEDKLSSALLESAKNASLIALQQKKPTEHRRLSQLHNIHDKPDLFANALAASARRASLSVSGHDITKEKPRRKIEQEVVKKTPPVPKTKEKPSVQSKPSTKQRRLSQLHRDLDNKADTEDLFANAVAASARRASVAGHVDPSLQPHTEHTDTTSKESNKPNKEDATLTQKHLSGDNKTSDGKSSKPHRRLSRLHDVQSKPDEDLFAKAVTASARRASVSVVEEQDTDGLLGHSNPLSSFAEQPEDSQIQSKQVEQANLADHNNTKPTGAESTHPDAKVQHARKPSFTYYLTFCNLLTKMQTEANNGSPRGDPPVSYDDFVKIVNQTVSPVASQKSIVADDSQGTDTKGDEANEQHLLLALYAVEAYLGATPNSLVIQPLEVVQLLDIKYPGCPKDATVPVDVPSDKVGISSDDLEQRKFSEAGISDEDYANILNNALGPGKKAVQMENTNGMPIQSQTDVCSEKMSSKDTPNLEQKIPSKALVIPLPGSVIDLQNDVGPEVDAQPDITAEVPVETNANAPTDVPLKVITDVPPEATINVPPEKATEVLTETSVDFPPDSTADVPSDTTADVPKEIAADFSSEAIVDVPQETNVYVPIGGTTDVPAEATADVPKKEIINVSSQATTDDPQDTMVDVPTDGTTDVLSEPTSHAQEEEITDVPRETTSAVVSLTTTNVPTDTTIDVPPELTINIASDTTIDVPLEKVSNVEPKIVTDDAVETTASVATEVTINVPLETTNDVPTQTNADVPPETTTDALQEANSDVPPETAIDDNPEITVDVQQEETAEFQHDTTLDVRSEAIDLPQEAITDVPSEVITNVPPEIAEDVPVEKTKDVPPKKDVPPEATKDVQAETDVPPEKTQHNKSEKNVPSETTTDFPSETDVPSKTTIDVQTDVLSETTIDVPPETNLPSEKTTDVQADVPTATTIDVPYETNVTSETTIDVPSKTNVPSETTIDVPSETDVQSETIDVQAETQVPSKSTIKDGPLERTIYVPTETTADIPPDAAEESFQPNASLPNVSEGVSKPDDIETKILSNAESDMVKDTNVEMSETDKTSFQPKDSMDMTEQPHPEESKVEQLTDLITVYAPCKKEVSASTEEFVNVFEDAPCRVFAPTEEYANVCEDSPCRVFAPTEESANVCEDAPYKKEVSAPTEESANVPCKKEAPTEDDYLEELFISDIMSSTTDTTLLGLPDLPTTDVADWDIPKLEDLDLPKPPTLTKPQQSSTVTMGSTEDAASVGSNSALLPPPPPSTPQNSPSNFLRSGIDDAIQAVLRRTNDGGGRVVAEEGKESSQTVVIPDQYSCRENGTAGKVEIQENDYVLTDSQINCLVDAYAPGVNLSQKSIRSICTASICAGMVGDEPPNGSKTDNLTTESQDTNTSSLSVPNMESSNNVQQ